MPSSARDHPPSFTTEPQYQRSERRMMKDYKKSKSRSALCGLVLCGCAIMFFALVLIGCSFAINYDEDLDFDNDEMDATIEAGFNYNQYWAGVPFFVTGTLVLFSAFFQRSRGLTMTAVIFCVLSVALTLFVIALESGNFVYWNSKERVKAYWDSKTGYSCGTNSASQKCECTSSSTPPSTIDISGYECNIVRKLSALYGAVLASAIMVTLFCLAAITVVVKSLSWKPHVYPSHSQSYYNGADEFYGDTGRHTPAYIDMPAVAKRANDYSEPASHHSNGRKPGPYRNYPF